MAQRRELRAKRPAKRAVDEAQKPDAAANYFVAVLGDTLAVQLANGLEETFADKPEIGVLSKTKESSGLVREDFYDWRKAARDIAGGTQKIDVAVVMIGSNDRQALRAPGAAQSEEPFSPRWRELYEARVDGLLAAFREKKIPVVWVGLPVMKNESFSADMAKLNDIFRERATKDGDVYVDLWEALADERGQFSAFGPDVNGQIVKLRTADGVHLTEAGALSVALFVSNEIKKLYEERRRDLPAEEPAAATPDASAPAPRARVRRAGHRQHAAGRISLPGGAARHLGPDAPGPSAHRRLATAHGRRHDVRKRGTRAARGARSRRDQRRCADAQALARHVFVEGGDQSPRPNRADDSAWKPGSP